MSELLELIPLTPEEEKKIPTARAKQAVLLRKLEMAVETARSRLGDLTEEEQAAVENLFKDPVIDDVPEYITVKEVAWLIGRSPQVIRRRCAQGIYKAYQPSGENGTWYIESEQFRSAPNWEEFLQKRPEMLKQTLHTDLLAFQLWYETDPEEEQADLSEET